MRDSESIHSSSKEMFLSLSELTKSLYPYARRPQLYLVSDVGKLFDTDFFSPKFLVTPKTIWSDLDGFIKDQFVPIDPQNMRAIQYITTQAAEFNIVTARPPIPWFLAGHRLFENWQDIPYMSNYFQHILKNALQEDHPYCQVNFYMDPRKFTDPNANDRLVQRIKEDIENKGRIVVLGGSGHIDDRIFRNTLYKCKNLGICDLSKLYYVNSGRRLV